MVISRTSLSRLFKLSFILLAVAGLSGCVYFNTFYHARKAFNDAESKREKGGRAYTARALAGLYKQAIEKSEKVIEQYPTSKWYDDALYINGVSYYYTEDFSKAEKRFREILANYPDSKYAKEARLYLAKTKLKKNEVVEAMSIFEELFSKSKDRAVKADAAMVLGEYHLENRNFIDARHYLGSVHDSLGNNEQKLKAQMYIADSYFDQFKCRDARENYLKILDMGPDSQDKYRALYQAGRSCYLINDSEEGMKYFNMLAEDPLYYDSLGAIKLQLAEGYEIDGDLILAEEIYHQVAVENEGRPAAAVANYNLGLIYQYDYEDYKKAKEYYDLAKSRAGGTDIYQDALQRSTDIGKLEQYSREITLDSMATQADIDSAASTQYLLGELYLTQLDRPDSAYKEFHYIIDAFPSSYFVPKAMIALAHIENEFYENKAAYDSLLRSVLKDYPHSDYAANAIDLLGLSGTRADTGYALYYYRKAEDFLFDRRNPDSASYYFRYIVDSFPRSRLAEKADFAALWITETYESPGDSSLYYAYLDFADTYQGTELAQEVDKKLYQRAVRQPDIFEEDVETTAQGEQAAIDEGLTAGEEEQGSYLSAQERYFTDPEGNTIREVEQGPIRTDREFRYPPAAYMTSFEGDIYFQIKLDAFGEIVDFRMMNPTPSEDLNEEVTEVLKTMHFDTGWMEPEEINTWFVYKYPVRLPLSLR